MEDIQKVLRACNAVEQSQNGYFDYASCKECGGKRCCAHFGCSYSTRDFIVLREEQYTDEQRLLILTELLKQGKISIDMIWGRDQVWGPLNPSTGKPDWEKIRKYDGYLFLRARNAGRPVVDFQKFLKHANYPCINWSPNTGCSLPEAERPFGGRMLKPIRIETHGKSYFHCVDMVDYDVLVAEWARHHRLMYELYVEIEKLNIP